MKSSLNARLKFVLLTFLTLVVGVAFLWTWFNWIDGLGKSDFSPAYEWPSGTLLLSYALVNEQTGSASLLPALFDFSVGEATYVSVDQGGETLTGIHHSLSPNGQWLTFIDSSVNEEGWPSDIYRVNLQNRSLSASLLAVSTATPITTQIRAAFPDVSDNGDILYMSVPAAADLSAEQFYVNSGAAWEVVWLNQANETKILTQGSHPQWLSNDDFLFLKLDGVYHYSLSNRQETMLIRSLSLVGPSHRLVLSEDGTRALLIEPAAGAVRLFDVISTPNDVMLQEKEPIMVNTTSAVFSPNGEYVAVTILPTNGSDLPLVIYDRAGNEVSRYALPNASLSFTSLQFWVR